MIITEIPNNCPDKFEALQWIRLKLCTFWAQKKRTAHERGAELVRSGAWASGRRWADDAPGQLIEQAAVQLLPGGAAGAFVHGLEDEFMGNYLRT